MKEPTIGDLARSGRPINVTIENYYEGARFDGPLDGEDTQHDPNPVGPQIGDWVIVRLEAQYVVGYLDSTFTTTDIKINDEPVRESTFVYLVDIDREKLERVAPDDVVAVLETRR